jgi:predicted XRE-type DNA-binding protein
MAKRKIEGTEIEESSGNVFADLGLANAEKLKIKSGLVIEITRAVRRLGLTQEEAGPRMGIPQPKVSGMLRGGFHQPLRAQIDGLPESPRLRHRNQGKAIGPRDGAPNARYLKFAIGRRQEVTWNDQ